MHPAAPYSHIPVCRQDLEARLSQLAAKLAALRSSFALIQDLVDLPGLSVWHAELSRVISANLAAEARRQAAPLRCVSFCDIPRLEARDKAVRTFLTWVLNIGAVWVARHNSWLTLASTHKEGRTVCRFTRIAESSAASTSGREMGGSAAAAVAGNDAYGEPVTFVGRCRSHACPFVEHRAELQVRVNPNAQSQELIISWVYVLPSQHHDIVIAYPGCLPHKALSRACPFVPG